MGKLRRLGERVAHVLQPALEQYLRLLGRESLSIIHGRPLVPFCGIPEACLTRAASKSAGKGELPAQMYDVCLKKPGAYGDFAEIRAIL